MFEAKPIVRGIALAFGGLAMASVVAIPAQAQQAAQQELERIEVTGSAIKRIDAETAVPVTVIRADDLKKEGITSVEQIMAVLSPVQLQQNKATAIGTNSGGAAFADMRAVGADKTLVLLNGQRIANNAVSGAAPDLNMIPFSAIERIEVLRDGASSLYGTDAIGGVINFITKNSYTGATISAGFDAPQKSGGSARSANLGLGFGDLAKDGWNVFGTLGLKKSDSIDGDQRNFNKRIVGGLSNSTFPANYQVVGGGAYYNPAAPGCDEPNLIANAAGTGCRIVTPPFVSISPRSETISGLLKGTFDVNSSLRLGAEAFYSKNTVETNIAPVPYGAYWINPGTTYFPADATTRPGYSPTFDYYGAAGEPFNNPTAQFPNPVNTEAGGVLVWWRDLVNGPRAGKDVGKQYRTMFTAEGNGGGWDYRAALAYNHTKNDRFLTGGYADGDVIGEGLIRGIINPFGDQTAEGEALIKGAALTGLLSTSIGKVTSLTGNASRELGDWFGASRPVQIAVGGEVRREDYQDYNHHDFAVAVSSSTGVDPDAHAEGARNVVAVYTELNLPVTKELDVTASVRHDRYNDVGNTTNPKLGFRFQPTKSIMVRGSASTGFRAPTLYELNQSPGFTNTSNYDNPLNCPNGVPNDPATAGANCDAQFQAYYGGNQDLKPEKSKSFTLGVMIEPIQNLSASVDFWAIRVKDVIGTIAEETLFSDYQTFQEYFHFAQPGNVLPQSTRACQDGPTSPTCGYVDERYQNLGGLNTHGLDLGLRYRLDTPVGRWGFQYESTWVHKYEYQDYKDGPWKQNVGVYSGAGPVFRWQHNATVNWTLGGWGAGLALHHKSGYLDQDPTNKVKAYTTADVYASYAPIKALTLLVGVRNVTDEDPPFSNQTALFQSGGWDSRYYDATGRAYYIRATYDF